VSEPTTDEKNQQPTRKQRNRSADTEATPKRVSERPVEHLEETTNETIQPTPPRGLRVVDSATEEEEREQEARRVRRATRQQDSFLEPVFERGLASDRYIEALKKGYDGVTNDDIPDEAYTVAGVTSNPEVAAQSGRRYIDEPDVHDRGRRELGERGLHNHNPSAVEARERREKRNAKADESEGE